MDTTIRLCGPLRVEIDGQRVEDRLPGRQGRLLFGYLAATRDRPTSRTELIDVLWPNAVPASPEAALNTVLARLRRSLGDEVIVGRSHLSLRLSDDAWVDLEAARRSAGEVEAAQAEGDDRRVVAAAREALNLLAARLLPEFEGPWLDEQRRELDELRVELLEAVAGGGLNLGGNELVAAERAARGLVEREPYREAGYALLMEIMARRGNIAEALRTFDRLRLRLRENLGTIPSAEVTALHERLLQTGEVSDEPDPTPVRALSKTAPGPSLPLPGLIARSEQKPFVGRTPQLDRLGACWRKVRAGEGVSVFVVGEPGIGKTRLAARMAAEVHAEGGAVLSGRADEETVVPYQPLVEALRHYASHARPESDEEIAQALADLGSLVPELGRDRGQLPPSAGSSEEEQENRRYRLFEAFVALFAHISRQRPLLLLVEDLHWADKPTLLLFRHLVRNVDDKRILLLGTYRDVEVGVAHPLAKLTADLRREHEVPRVTLDGLDELETAALVTARVEERASEGFARALVEQTSGNPFYIEEVLRGLREANMADGCGVVSERALQSLGVPEGVKEVITRRFDRLGEQCKDLLVIAAALGRDFELQTLQAIADEGSDHALLVLEEALEAGLVLEVPGEIDRFSFCHAIVRETLYELPRASRRARLHRRVGLALEERRDALDVHPAELAHHFFEAGGLGMEDRATRYALEAAERARETHAYEEGAMLYERALELLNDTDPDKEARRCEALVGLGGARWQAGEPGARAAFEQAAEIARRRGARDHFAQAVLGAGGRFYSPRIDRPYTALVEDALGAFTGEESSLRARLLARLAESLALSEPARAVALAREATAMARRLDDGGGLLAGLMGLHAALLHVENLAERITISEEVVSLARRRDQREVAALGRHWQLYDLFELGDLDTARKVSAALEADARELQQPLYRHATLAWRGAWAQLHGELTEAEALAHDSLRLAKRARARDARSNVVGQLLVIRRDQGRLGDLLADLEEVIAGDPTFTVLQAAMPLVLIDAGEASRGRSAFERLASDDFASIPPNLYWLPALAWLADAAARLSDATDRAAALYRRLEPHAERMVQTIFTGSLGSVHHFLGLLAGTVAQWDAGHKHFEAAIERHRTMRAPLLLARSLEGYAEMLSRAGHEVASERREELMTEARRLRGHEPAGSQDADSRRGTPS